MATALGSPSRPDPLSRVVTVSNTDGRLETFAIDPQGGVIHSWQLSPNGAWGGWQWTGARSRDGFTVGTAADGRLELFVAGPRGELLHRWQLRPGGSWSGWRAMELLTLGAPVAVRRPMGASNCSRPTAPAV